MEASNSDLLNFRALPTHAVVASIDLHVFRWANAGVISQGVVAGPRSTYTRMCKALINIYGMQEYPSISKYFPHELKWLKQLNKAYGWAPQFLFL